MRITAIFLAVVTGLQVYGPAAQMLREDPDRSGVTTHVYEFKDDKVTRAPRGYRPFYLLHYGRHGSRVDFKVEDYLAVEDILCRAKEGGFLSDAGDSLLSETRQILETHGGDPGHLTRRGELEEREIARRIFEKYKPVFRRGNGNIRVKSSHVPRVLVSMASFIAELSRKTPKLDFAIESGEKIYAWIYNAQSDEHRSAALVLQDSLIKATPVDSVSIYGRLFTDPEKGKELAPDADNFQYHIWRTGRIATSSGLEKNPLRFLPEDVIYKWWDVSNRYFYIRHSNSIEFGEDRMKQTVPLVEKVFEFVDDALASGEVSADLLFGHDYPLLALAGWFGLEGLGDRMRYEDVPQNWNDPTNIPFASNMQMVFFRSRKKNAPILVKFVYNGRERKINGLEPVGEVYYKWEDLSRFRPGRLL